MREAGTEEPGTITFVARETSFQVAWSESIVSKAVMGGLKLGEEMVCCAYGGGLTMRSGGNEIGLAKMEAASLEGEAIMEGGLKAMNLISSALLFMTWNIEL